MPELKDKVAVVTGAGSGIGRALAMALADQGCRLAISDISETPLQETRDKAAAAGVAVHAKVLDVADRDAFHAYADEVMEEYGAVNLVVNNAGVALGVTIDDMAYDDAQWLFDINFWGVVHGTKAFLPHLRASGSGHIVNISSIFGLIALPGVSAYHASKFAVRGFTECLRVELDIEGVDIGVTCVHPGGINTNLISNSRIHDLKALERSAEDVHRLFEKLLRTSPEHAARMIVNGVKKNKRRVLIGSDARFGDVMQRLMPATYQRIVAYVVRKKWL